MEFYFLVLQALSSCLASSPRFAMFPGISSSVCSSGMRKFSLSRL